MPLKIIFMGTPDFARASLAAIIASSHPVVGVVTQPDREVGRNRKPSIPPVKELALQHSIPIIQPERLKRAPEALHTLREWNADVVVVAAYGQILAKDHLEVARLGSLNVHASLLPRYRGAAPINWCIVRGEEKTGVTIMQMDEGLDTGDMLLWREIEIGESESAGELHDRLALLGGELIVEALDLLEEGKLTPVPQNDEDATWAPMLKKEDGRLDFRRPVDELVRQVRGMHPWPGSFTFFEDKRVKLHRARVASTALQAEIPGEIFLDDGHLLVACGQGVMQVDELQVAGARAMSGLDFVNGYRVQDGSRFSQEPS